MIVIGTDIVETYFKSRAGHRGIKAARAQYDAWLAIAETADWKTPEEVKKAHMKTTLIVIQNEADHADAKKLIERLMGSSDSQDRARMVAQARLVEAYERAQWPRTAPALPVLLTYLMDQHGLSRADLVPLLGTASRVSEVLTGKRDLSMTMVRRLRERFNVSADLLVSRSRARNRIAA